MIVATAGHIDHGKTALVRALTGVDTTHLPEERRRGITVDLGYAYAPGPGGRRIGFVDVPGHERLVRTMVAGATGVDLALLVVAADDGPMPQTREHLAILDLLGLGRAVVALTKSDRVDPARSAAAAAEVAAMLRGTALATAPVVPCSSVTGEGIAALRALIDAWADAPDAAPRGGFRLAVDRAFTVAGAGLVVTGAVHGGAVAIGQRLVVARSGVEVRVRGLHAQNRPAERGAGGQRLALNIAGPRLDRAPPARGDWLVDPGLEAESARFDVALRLLPGEARALKHWTPVHVHIGAADIPGRVGLLEGSALQPGGTAMAQLVLDAPVAALGGDRFVVRDQSATRSLGGGRVLDPAPPRRGARRPDRLRTLDALARPDGEALAALLDACEAGIDLAWFRRTRNLLAREVEGLGIPSIAVGGLAFSARWRDALSGRILAAAAAEAAADPDAVGATADQLLRRLPAAQRVPARELLRDLASAGALERHGALYHRPGHAPRLDAAEEDLWIEVRGSLARAGADQPRVALLAERLAVSEADLRPLLGKLARMGRLTRVAPTYYMLPETLGRLARAAADVARGGPGGLLTVGRFRDATGINRNAVMPVLEFFDRAGLTTRRPDGRALRPDRVEIFDGGGA